MSQSRLFLLPNALDYRAKCSPASDRSVLYLVLVLTKTTKMLPAKFINGNRFHHYYVVLEMKRVPESERSRCLGTGFTNARIPNPFDKGFALTLNRTQMKKIFEMTYLKICNF